MYPTTREFVAALDQAGQLARVRARVSPVLEIAQIADRVSKSPAPTGPEALPSASARRSDPRFHHLGGKALLFENVEGSDIPVLINAFGSYRRMEMALGRWTGGFEDIQNALAELVKPEPPRSLGAAFAKARKLLPLFKIPPKRRKGRGLCQEVVITGDQIDLRRLPLLRCWPLDGDLASIGYPAATNGGISGVESGPEWEKSFRGRYITLGGIHTIHADDKDNPKPSSHNIGMYRVQLLGQKHMAMHWHMHHDGARHWRSWKAKGEKMPVAIALGGESVLPYAATAPLPPGISELLLAGFLNRKGIGMCRARTVPLWVPENAEIVIEGYVSAEAGGINYDPRRDGPLGPGAVFEGPFGDHTGFYSLPDRYPLLEVTAITHRRDPIYPTTIVGLPPQEDYYLGKATERLFLPLLKTLIHDIEDYDLPMFGAFHNCAFVKIRKQYPAQARRVMHSVWGAGQMAWTKTIFVVDNHVDVHDAHAVLRAAAQNCRPGADIETVNGPVDILDHAAPRLGVGTKVGFDCTRRWEDEKGLPVRTAPVSRVRVPRDARPLSSFDSPERDRILSELTPPHGASTVRFSPSFERLACPASLEGGWLLARTASSEDWRDAIDADPLARALAEKSLYCPTIILLGDVDPADTDAALFHWLANFDAGRDVVHVLFDGEPARVATQIFDATPKRPGTTLNGQPVRDWPPLIRMDETTTARVEERWGEYGLPGVTSGR
jgi:4-hydroxy-3-polyprenylbenzoate decarboxylase